MKTFVSLFLLAGVIALATPAQAQQSATRLAANGSFKPTNGLPASNAQTAAASVAEPKLTWQQRRAIKRKKLTPYAEAMLHNELLREEPAKKTGTSLF
ncbi:hypothetical protein [Hymenobacter lapidiphilus]|uniref:Uncharacterized protein n=1 Tax=Hymenobacter lapidiphilus TaxID=2608003 RepID=A0A7Y7PN81_9BACT|nr:hypothetical protein [Hymenobacter lapidiphilus]NVO30936.1 hypothetical protein [Hymenobacter lapidiphilus]